MTTRLPTTTTTPVCTPPSTWYSAMVRGCQVSTPWTSTAPRSRPRPRGIPGSWPRTTGSRSIRSWDRWPRARPSQGFWRAMPTTAPRRARKSPSISTTCGFSTRPTKTIRIWPTTSTSSAAPTPRATIPPGASTHPSWLYPTASTTGHLWPTAPDSPARATTSTRHTTMWERNRPFRASRSPMWPATGSVPAAPIPSRPIPPPPITAKTICRTRAESAPAISVMRTRSPSPTTTV